MHIAINDTTFIDIHVIYGDNYDYYVGMV